MAFRLFRKRELEPAVPAAEPIAQIARQTALLALDSTVNGRHWGGFRTACKL
jgi:hypothetical protein